MSGAELAPFVAAILGDRRLLELREENQTLRDRIIEIGHHKKLRDKRLLVITRPEGSSNPIISEANLVLLLPVGPPRLECRLLPFPPADQVLVQSLPKRWVDFMDLELHVCGHSCGSLRKVRPRDERKPNIVDYKRCDSRKDYSRTAANRDYVVSWWTYPIGLTDETPLVLAVESLTVVMWDDARGGAPQHVHNERILGYLSDPWWPHVYIHVQGCYVAAHASFDNLWGLLNRHLIMEDLGGRL